jgi:hypothetical protein
MRQHARAYASEVVRAAIQIKSQIIVGVAMAVQTK